ncbi:hypothetical protein E5288_WYG015966 [Bos mutus]|uniref:CDK2-associated and cullin domain-containing protein 1 n=1 Tax=Bos mutus TaxID=72004 RepID=A0A6B0S1B2_9CETA|nr:hypothetical protein [Bos mutus]
MGRLRNESGMQPVLFWTQLRDQEKVGNPRPSVVRRPDKSGERKKNTAERGSPGHIDRQARLWTHLQSQTQLPVVLVTNLRKRMRNSSPLSLMNVITIEDYKSTYWPKLDGAIDQLLTQSPGDYIPISYEQIYSCVYKCVCQQHSEQMYSDLIKKITNHLERVSKELQASPPDLYIERFNIALGQYMGALQSIVPLFIYMNKFYIETKLNRDLKDDLIKLFTEHVAEKHIYSLMPLLLEAQSTPFQVTPSTMANIVKGLYTLRPEWVQMAPTLFSKFIPNILPRAVESELSEYAAQDQKLQRELIQNGFMRQVFLFLS